MIPELGIIEGRFGRSWSWIERQRVVEILAPAGYGFYHYGPKADAQLRRRWREPYSAAALSQLAAFAAFCREHGMRFGIAVTPIDAAPIFDAGARAALRARVLELHAIGLDDLAILFDDVRGDHPGLAAIQADIVHYAAEHAGGARIFCCPTYYSSDPVLDRVFGQRADDYLTTLGRRLDAAIHIYWTGEEVCAREIRPGHLDEIAGQLGRPVSLWDNYPVNDGARLSRYLHVRGFTGRDPASARHLRAHAINPAVQPLLSCIPALTLVESYRQGSDYRYSAAFRAAALTVAGPTLSTMLEADLIALNDLGLDRLDDERRSELRARYSAVDHPAAAEVLRWLSGEDLVTNEEVKTQ